MATSKFDWTQQNNYSWRGSYNGTPYWVILSADQKQYILQIPGIYAQDNGLNNLVFDSFEEAKLVAERSMTDEDVN
jgi:hypothetical protein